MDRTSEMIGQLKCTESWLIRVDSKLDALSGILCAFSCKLDKLNDKLDRIDSGMSKDDVTKLVADIEKNIKRAEALGKDKPT